MQWPLGRREGNLVEILNAVALLRAFKNVYTYKELESILGIKPSILSSYVQGDVLPSLGRATEIISSLAKKDRMKKYLMKLLSRKGYSIGDLFINQDFMYAVAIFFAKELLTRLAGTKISYVLTFSGYSAVIAAYLSRQIGLRIVVINALS